MFATIASDHASVRPRHAAGQARTLDDLPATRLHRCTKCFGQVLRWLAQASIAL